MVIRQMWSVLQLYDNSLMAITFLSGLKLFRNIQQHRNPLP